MTFLLLILGCEDGYYDTSKVLNNAVFDFHVSVGTVKVDDEIYLNFSLDPDFNECVAYELCIKVHSYPQKSSQCLYYNILVWDSENPDKNIVNQPVTFLNNEPMSENSIQKTYTLKPLIPGKYDIYVYCHGYPIETSQYLYNYSERYILTVE